MLKKVYITFFNPCILQRLFQGKINTDRPCIFTTETILVLGSLFFSYTNVKMNSKQKMHFHKSNIQKRALLNLKVQKKLFFLKERLDSDINIFIKYSS